LGESLWKAAFQNIPQGYQIVSKPFGKDVFFRDSGCHLFPGLNQRPPAISEIRTNATATHEKAVLFVEMPTTKNVMPRIRKTLEILRLFKFICD